jgi:hypothetical protein
MRTLSWLGLAPLSSELRLLISSLAATSRAFFVACRSPRGALWLLLLSSLTTLWLWLFMPELGLLRDTLAARMWLTRADGWGYLVTMLIVGIGRKR